LDHSNSLKGFNSNLIKNGIQGNPFSQKILRESKFYKKKRIPTLVRIINREENTFQKTFRYGSNLRFLREYNFKPEMEIDTGEYNDD
jgi:hypothetical protein